MAKLLSLVEYRDLPDGEPDFSFIAKAIVVGLREGSEIALVPDLEGLRITIDAATGLVPTGLTLSPMAARQMRDYLIRLCDQICDERYPR